MEDARKAFDIHFEKNLVSYNAIVDRYGKNLKSEETFLLFNEITDTGIGINAFTFASLLSGAASIGAMGKGEQIHGQLLKEGYESNQCIFNALISIATDVKILEYPNRFRRGCANNPISHSYFLTVLEQELLLLFFYIMKNKICIRNVPHLLYFGSQLVQFSINFPSLRVGSVSYMEPVHHIFYLDPAMASFFDQIYLFHAFSDLGHVSPLAC